MYFQAKFHIISTTMLALLIFLAGAEPTLLAMIEVRQYQNYCCLPGCGICSHYSCVKSPCYGVVSSPHSPLFLTS
ncbi:hypothetical protein F4781DRAFT_400809 [Annulohypoxylon bovei var. microspora]|nr:hypothetical protein F4781DRAFT_400809 [Annulohypoxylon bovei var. microspora]